LRCLLDQPLSALHPKHPAPKAPLPTTHHSPPSPLPPTLPPPPHPPTKPLQLKTFVAASKDGKALVSSFRADGLGGGLTIWAPERSGKYALSHKYQSTLQSGPAVEPDAYLQTAVSPDGVAAATFVGGRTAKLFRVDTGSIFRPGDSTVVDLDVDISLGLAGAWQLRGMGLSAGGAYLSAVFSGGAQTHYGFWKKASDGTVRFCVFAWVGGSMCVADGCAAAQPRVHAACSHRRSHSLYFRLSSAPTTTLTPNQPTNQQYALSCKYVIPNFGNVAADADSIPACSFSEVKNQGIRIACAFFDIPNRNSYNQDSLVVNQFAFADLSKLPGACATPKVLYDKGTSKAVPDMVSGLFGDDASDILCSALLCFLFRASQPGAAHKTDPAAPFPPPLHSPPQVQLSGNGLLVGQSSHSTETILMQSLPTK